MLAREKQDIPDLLADLDWSRRSRQYPSLALTYPRPLECPQVRARPRDLSSMRPSSFPPCPSHLDDDDRSPTLAARRCREHPMPNTRSRRCRLRGPRRSASGRVCWRNDGSTEPLVLVRTGWSGEQQQKQEQEQGKAKNSEHVTNPGTHVGQAQGHDRSIWVITSDSRDEDSVDLQKVSGMSSDDAQQGELSQ